MELEEKRSTMSARKPSKSVSQSVCKSVSRRKRWRRKRRTNPDEVAFIDSDGEYTVIEKKKPTEVESPPADQLNNSVIIECTDLSWDLNNLPMFHDAIVELEDPIEIREETFEEEDHDIYNMTEYPRSLFDFDWKPLPHSHQNKREVFTGPTPGPTKYFSTPYEAFVEIWDESILQLIVDETNIYARQTNAGQSWNDTNVDELYIYFAILISFGLCIKANINEYFYNFSDLIDTPNFNNYMTYERFISLNNYLHFANNADLDVNSLIRAKCFKIESIISHLNKKFQKLYNLDRDITIVESLLKARGLPDIIGHVKSETDSEVLKSFELCDIKSGYLWRVEIYTGEEKHKNAQKTSPITGPIPNLVIKFMNSLQNRGHTLFMDTFFNSPALARVLKASGTDCVGTLQTSRQFVPRLQEDKLADQTSGDVNIIIRRDKNRTAFISTYHSNVIVGQQNAKGKTQKTPVVEDYIDNLGAVDRRDQLIANCRIEQGKGKIWYKKVFRHLFTVSILNSWILHKSAPGVVAASYRTFRYDIVNAILNKHFRPREVILLTPASAKVSKPVFSMAALEHFPREYGFSPPPSEKERICKPCTICSEIVHTYCQGCQITLCAFTCHITYHASII